MDPIRGSPGSSQLQKLWVWKQKLLPFGPGSLGVLVLALLLEVQA